MEHGECETHDPDDASCVLNVYGPHSAVWRALLDKHISGVRTGRASSAGLVRHRNPRVRMEYAQHPACSQTDLLAMSDDRDPVVRVKAQESLARSCSRN